MSLSSFRRWRASSSNLRADSPPPPIVRAPSKHRQGTGQQQQQQHQQKLKANHEQADHHYQQHLEVDKELDPAGSEPISPLPQEDFRPIQQQQKIQAQTQTQTQTQAATNTTQSNKTPDRKYSDRTQQPHTPHTPKLHPSNSASVITSSTSTQLHSQTEETHPVTIALTAPVSSSSAASNPQPTVPPASLVSLPLDSSVDTSPITPRLRPPAVQASLILAYCRAWLLATEEYEVRARLNDTAADKHALKARLHQVLQKFTAEEKKVTELLQSIQIQEEQLRAQLDELTVQIQSQQHGQQPKHHHHQPTPQQTSTQGIQPVPATSNAKTAITTPHPLRAHRQQLWTEIEQLIHRRNAARSQLLTITQSLTCMTQALYQTHISLREKYTQFSTFEPDETTKAIDTTVIQETPKKSDTHSKSAASSAEPSPGSRISMRKKDGRTSALASGVTSKAASAATSAAVSTVASPRAGSVNSSSAASSSASQSDSSASSPSSSPSESVRFVSNVDDWVLNAVNRLNQLRANEGRLEKRLNKLITNREQINGYFERINNYQRKFSEANSQPNPNEISALTSSTSTSNTALMIKSSAATQQPSEVNTTAVGSWLRRHSTSSSLLSLSSGPSLAVIQEAEAKQKKELEQLHRIVDCIENTGLAVHRRVGGQLWPQTLLTCELVLWFIRSNLMPNRVDALELIDLLRRSGLLVDVGQQNESGQTEVVLVKKGDKDKAAPSVPISRFHPVYPNSFADADLLHAVYVIQRGTAALDDMTKIGWMEKIGRYRSYSRYFVWDTDLKRLSCYGSDKEQQPLKVYWLDHNTKIKALDSKPQQQQKTDNPSASTDAGQTKYYCEIVFAASQHGEGSLLLGTNNRKNRDDWIRIMTLAGTKDTNATAGGTGPVGASQSYAADAKKKLYAIPPVPARGWHNALPSSMSFGMDAVLNPLLSSTAAVPSDALANSVPVALQQYRHPTLIAASRGSVSVSLSVSVSGPSASSPVTAVDEGDDDDTVFNPDAPDVPSVERKREQLMMSEFNVNRSKSIMILQSTFSSLAHKQDLDLGLIEIANDIEAESESTAPDSSQDEGGTQLPNESDPSTITADTPVDEEDMYDFEEEDDEDAAEDDVNDDMSSDDDDDATADGVGGGFSSGRVRRPPPASVINEAYVKMRKEQRRKMVLRVVSKVSLMLHHDTNPLGRLCAIFTKHFRSLYNRALDVEGQSLLTSITSLGNNTSPATPAHSHTSRLGAGSSSLFSSSVLQFPPPSLNRPQTDALTSSPSSGSNIPPSPPQSSNALSTSFLSYYSVYPRHVRHILKSAKEDLDSFIQQLVRLVEAHLQPDPFQADPTLQSVLESAGSSNTQGLSSPAGTRHSISSGQQFFPSQQFIFGAESNTVLSPIHSAATPILLPRPHLRSSATDYHYDITHSTSEQMFIKQHLVKEKNKDTKCILNACIRVISRHLFTAVSSVLFPIYQIKHAQRDQQLEQKMRKLQDVYFERLGLSAELVLAGMKTDETHKQIQIQPQQQHQQQTQFQQQTTPPRSHMSDETRLLSPLVSSHALMLELDGAAQLSTQLSDEQQLVGLGRMLPLPPLPMNHAESPSYLSGATSPSDVASIAPLSPVPKASSPSPASSSSLPYHHALVALSALPDIPDPYDKLSCVLRVARAICKSVDEAHHRQAVVINADDLLLLFTYLIITLSNQRHTETPSTQEQEKEKGATDSDSLPHSFSSSSVSTSFSKGSAGSSMTASASVSPSSTGSSTVMHHWHAHLALMADYITDKQRCMLRGYYLATIQAALELIMTDSFKNKMVDSPPQQQDPQSKTVNTASTTSTESLSSPSFSSTDKVQEGDASACLPKSTSSASSVSVSSVSSAESAASPAPAEDMGELVVIDY